MDDILNGEEQNTSELNSEIAEKEIANEIQPVTLEHKSENQAEHKPEEVLTDDIQEQLREYKRKIQDIESKTKTEIEKVQNCLNAGLINSLQAQNLIQLIMQKGRDGVQNCEFKTPQPQNLETQENEFDTKRAIIEFENENPDFFNQNGRLDVLNYVKSGCLEFDKGEFVQISKLIETVENAAVERYLKKAEYEAKMNKSNEMAKSRLNANAQKSGDTSSTPQIFTREQIGKMSGAEFTKNEKLIMEQLKKGLIR